MKKLLNIKLKMLFKIGLTIVILVAVYLYCAIKSIEHLPKNSETKVPAAEDSIFISGKQSFDSNINKVAEPPSEREFEQSNVKPDANDPIIRKKDMVKAVVPAQTTIHLAVVACGSRLEETMMLLKSAVMFTSSHIMIHIFAEEHIIHDFDVQLTWWPALIRMKYDFHVYNLSFPAEKTEQWENLFKPCASQRLFLPNLLPDVDALIYVDTDILFLRPLDDLWSFFHKFNSSQLVALSPESEDEATGWYNRFALHPFYGILGVNSGVMLMNLTRLRNSEWMKSIVRFYQEYKLRITWGDQDLINIYFHYNPEQLYIYGCQWNFRPDHCMYTSDCKGAELDGVSIIHGSRRVWLTDKEPVFRSIYLSIKKYDLGIDTFEDLLEMMNKEMIIAKNTNCGKLSKLFTKHIEEMINVTVVNNHIN